jgi:hypothetical protein
MSRCAACGRRLRRPSPSGLGPVCFRRLNPAPARTPARAAKPPVEPIPGQTKIELTHFQPTLGSI